MSIKENKAEIVKAGGKLEKIDSSRFFVNPPIEMLCFDGDGLAIRKMFVIGLSTGRAMPVLAVDKEFRTCHYVYCKAIPEKKNRLMTAEECFGKILHSDSSKSLITEISGDCVIWDGGCFEINELQDNGYQISNTIDGEKSDFYVEEKEDETE